MSTNARIGVERPLTNEVESIYTHWDGYPSHHGPLLLDHWSEWGQVEQLIALGDLSVLGKAVGEKHDFATPIVDYCRAYGRDRGETDKDSVSHPADEWPDYGQEYEYLFTSRREWIYRQARYTRTGPTDWDREWTRWEPLTPSSCIDDVVIGAAAGDPLGV